jgi:hypothetical protein
MERTLKNDALLLWKFVNWVLENQKVDGKFSKKIIFSDKAHFQLDGYVNTLTVGFGARRILEWFMKSHCMHNEPLFGADFGLAEWLGRAFSKMGRKCSYSEWRMLSQHDNEVLVASIGRYGYGRHVVPAGRRNLSHCARNNWVVELLREKFPGRVISRNGDQNWPPRSCDLAPCDFFLWRLVKSHVHANKPQQFLSSRRRF